MSSYQDADSDSEEAEFPIVCETCLGPNPFVRMIRIKNGAQCHISGRPYTVFRWKPGSDARYKKTIICQEVAKAKNVCQVCLLDLDYNLPVQVRDTALGAQVEDIPASDVGKEYQLQMKQNKGELDDNYNYNTGKPSDMVRQLARTQPYYKRNRAQICSFFVRGECQRGAECPYRHEMPNSGELANQNIRDRYYGINDPVAKKLLRRAGDMPTQEPPEDKSITTLYIGNVTDITEQDIIEHFQHFGPIEQVKMFPTRNFALLTYKYRLDAEKAIEELLNRLIIKGARQKLSWGKAIESKIEDLSDNVNESQDLTQSDVQGSKIIHLPKTKQEPAVIYPSMDPEQQGSRPDIEENLNQQKEEQLQSQDFNQRKGQQTQSNQVDNQQQKKQKINAPSMQPPSDSYYGQPSQQYHQDYQQQQHQQSQQYQQHNQYQIPRPPQNNTAMQPPMGPPPVRPPPMRPPPMGPPMSMRPPGPPQSFPKGGSMPAPPPPVFNFQNQNTQYRQQPALRTGQRQ